MGTERSEQSSAIDKTDILATLFGAEKIALKQERVKLANGRFLVTMNMKVS